MKESITKFDLEAAFKALDELEIPVTEKGIKANKPALTEIFSRKSKLDLLMEEYYDVGNKEELSDAKEAREAEVAKAKLARIEKIVDLDAESPEDLLTTYVGKFIIQCPQCMTLFYKNPEDVEESEEDPTTVNVNEVCQHCGNESGYTLIGKVGEATPEETAEINDELEVDITSTEEMEEASEELEEPVTDETDDAFDLDVDLDELDLDSEEDTDKKEELLFSKKDDQTLMEDVDLEVSSEEFEKLIKSPEFQKPITDADTRAMIDTLNDKNGEDLQEDTDPEKNISDEKEINSNGKQKNDEVASDLLTEGIFDKFKDKLSGAIDKITSSLKSRESKADWIRENAMEDYDSVKIDNKGMLIPDEKNKKFNAFLIIGFKNKYSNGKLITTAPSFSNKDLVVGMERVEARKSYKDADALAKGWSLRQGNGPAFIYLAKDEKDSKAVFLCEYFNGELEYDQLEKYFKVVKNDLKACKLMNKGGLNQNQEEQDNADQSNTSEVTASEVKQGMKLQLGKETGEVIEISKSRLRSSDLAIKVKFADGSTETMSVDPKANINVLNIDSTDISTAESLNVLMQDVEELHEASLENLIANSLIETYKNVAGFRLTSCSYLNEAFRVDGTIYFTSGNTRKTTYTFSEAYVNKDTKIKLCGLNEKLGLDKQFIITGYTDKSNKAFIAESFKFTKNNK